MITAMDSQNNPRFEWFQNQDYITIEIFVKEKQRQNVNVSFEKQAVVLKFDKLADSEPQAVVKEFALSHEIVPEKSSHKLMSTKIEIKCEKKLNGLQWGSLEGADGLGAGTILNAVTENGPPAYPSSSKKKKDFNRLEKEIEQQKDPAEENALNSLFQKIYKDGSEETRRAMIKSFVESGGTTLSTNWSEVKKAPVEIKPPDGMEPRKYND